MPPCLILPPSYLCFSSTGINGLVIEMALQQGTLPDALEIGRLQARLLQMGAKLGEIRAET